MDTLSINSAKAPQYRVQYDTQGHYTRVHGHFTQSPGPRHTESRLDSVQGNTHSPGQYTESRATHRVLIHRVQGYTQESRAMHRVQGDTQSPDLHIETPTTTHLDKSSIRCGVVFKLMRTETILLKDNSSSTHRTGHMYNSYSSNICAQHS